jgi:hypothetical protein
MRKTVILLLALFATGCGDCNREVSDSPYQGDATALAPYVEAVGLHLDPGGCDQLGCTYFMYGEAWLHNPRSEAFNTDITCEFWDDNYLIGESTRAGITIDASRSKEFEFREQYTTSEPSNLTFGCELR